MDTFNGSLKAAAQIADGLLAPILNEITPTRSSRLRLEIIKALRAAYQDGTKEGTPSNYGDTTYTQRLQAVEAALGRQAARISVHNDRLMRAESNDASISDRLNRLERNRYGR